MGVLISLIIIATWTIHLAFVLVYIEPDLRSITLYFHIVFQTYLFTGLFITAHDAMHKNISANKRVNKLLGTISCFLFAGMSFPRLVKNHFKHHSYPASKKDPDYFTSSQNFFLWFFGFMFRYTTITQLLTMAILYNILKYFIASDAKLLLFWILPALLGTIQLFLFGTYIPHKLPHTQAMGEHKSRTLKKNHLLAMFTCYFFGYHSEHHDSPSTPWWKLYSLK